MKNTVYLDITNKSCNLGGYDPKDRWSRDSYKYIWDFHGFTNHNVSSHYSLPVNDLDSKKLLFAVYVIYSTGDSFGSDEDSNLELIYIGHNEELAHKIKILIEEDYNNNHDRNNNHIVVDGVKVFTYPWKGYFETLSRVCVENGYIQ